MRTQIALTGVLVFISAGTCLAEDWPQFLGPARNGVSAETKLIETFPEEGPEILWRQPLGTSMSGIAVSDGVAYTLYQNEDQQLVAMDALTGETKWTTPIAPAYENAMGNGPRATPAVHDGMVYAFSGEGILAAVEAASGKMKWSVNTPKDLVCKPAEYGMASSPLVTGDSIIVQVGSHRGTVAAFDRTTGKRKWVAGEGYAGYSSPVLTTLAGKEQIVALVGAEVMGIDPADGKMLWNHEFITDFNCNTATPVRLDEGSLLISAGENHGSMILKITSEDGALSAEEGWSSLGKDSVLRAEWQTPVQLDGHVYALDNVGGAGPITNLVCLRVADGEVAWGVPRFGKSNLILADGKLFISTMRGELVIVTATPDSFQETGRAVVLGSTRQAPVIANGRLYLRDDKEVVCVNVKAK